ncbi:MAG TPA: T9SS type A sorting domain-containing protein [Bacteroidia bacterium]|jgi:hypothetical protein|nr:T9SS type A sorting domain-containing protein [Bacteroidia bacterium]
MKKIIIIALVCFNHLNAQVCFNPVTNFGIVGGTKPQSIISADFNMDGKLDLATANFNSSNISIFLGTGTGSFNPTTNFIVGTNPYSICSADFNSDGKLDLATANYSSDDISVLLGNGAGSFTATTSYTFALNTNPCYIISADFNNDTKADLATANFGTNNIAVMIGNGNGSFGASTSHAPNTAPVSLSSGDFNNDGIIDIAAANGNGTGNLSILLGYGVGTGFSPVTSYTAGTKAWSIISTDFNGDGNNDLAVANRNSSNISLLLGSGTGSFGTATNFTVGLLPYSIVSGDFNGDTYKDLAVANENDNDVSILLGTGTGSFGVATNFTVGTNPWSIVNGDFNGDGKADLATANNSSNNVSVLLNCNNTTGVKFAEENNELKIYPNPNDGNFIIEPNSSAKQTLQLYDANYRLILSQVLTGKTVIDVSDLNNGVYNLSLISSESVLSKRMIIIK